MSGKIEFLVKIKDIGIPFVEFNNNANLHAEELLAPIIDDHKKLLHGFTQLNQRRTARILKSYRVSEEASQAMESIKTPQTWLIITEDWCGDSAQNIPFLFMMSLLNPNINIKIIYRDENLDIIDKYLTNGGRAIPKVIGLDTDGNELFQWGPRPEVAKKLVKDWKESGLKKEEFNKKLHLWYGRDRGKTFEKEFIELFPKMFRE